MSRSSFGGHGRLITNSAQFEDEYQEKVLRLLSHQPIVRGAAHAMSDDTTVSTHELMYVTEHIKVDNEVSAWQATINPNLPWAEDHFKERVGGEPLNPSPSEAWWPFARQGNAEHKQDQVFSHTYPERFWPKQAGLGKWACTEMGYDLHGIRFDYSDLEDLVQVLSQNPMSRQAYLPIWFPEDLTAAREGQRVPCSMGYHFVWCQHCDALDCVYTMRSCDIVRFYRDDVYMAGRLLQWVADRVGASIGTLVLNIDNLHCFPGDRLYLENQLPKSRHRTDRRASYNFEAMG